MLLDDVMSELDSRPATLLAMRLAEGGQAVLTATDPDHLPSGCDRAELSLPPGRGSGRAHRWRREPRAARRARSPRRSAGARAGAEPLTLLAAVQSAWPTAAGAGVAAEAEPVAERDGVVTVACRSATWAQELDLLGPELLGRLNEALSEAGQPPRPRAPVRALRFTADQSRHRG